MIRSFEILDPENTHIEWWDKVPALAKPRKFEFTPGLNILWGTNGSGKTTVIKALARLFHCEQGSVPVLTHTSICNLFERRSRNEDTFLKAFPKALKVNHDDQAVRYFDPSVAVGLFGGGAAFDDDFFEAGLSNTLFKGSAGQTTMFRFDALVTAILQNEVPKIVRKMSADQVNHVWSKRLQIAEKFLKGSGDLGPPTVLLDEPERSYDLPHQLGIWRFLRALSSRVQFIVASHSFYALNLPEANYIEMEKGYLTDSMMCLAQIGSGTWFKEKPDASEYDKKLAAMKKRKKA